MAIVSGLFLPSPGHAAVEPMFRKLSDAVEARSVSAEMYAERDALNLSILGPGDVVLPTEFVTVYDFGEALDRELEVKLGDVTAWTRARRAGGTVSLGRLMEILEGMLREVWVGDVTSSTA